MTSRHPGTWIRRDRAAFLEMPVFETIAFLSTLMFIAVFIFLFRMDRASRRNDEQ